MIFARPYPLPEPFKMPGYIGKLAFSPDGRWLAVAGGIGDGLPAVPTEVYLYQWPAGTPVRNLKGAGGRLTHLVFSPDSKLLAGGGGSEVLVWDLDKEAPRQRFERRDSVTGLGFLADNRTLVAASIGSGKGSDGACAWNVSDGKPIALSWGKEPNTRAFTLVGSTQAALSSNSNLYLYSLPDGRKRRLAQMDKHIQVVVGSGDERFVAGKAAADVVLWNVKELRQVPLLEMDAAFNPTLSPDGRLLAARSYKKDIQVWDTTTGKEVARFPNASAGHNVSPLAFTADSSTLAACGSTRVLEFWDVSRLGSPPAIADTKKARDK
jgi:WD40 repeat protein